MRRVKQGGKPVGKAFLSRRSLYHHGMCTLYRLSKPREEVARWFRATTETARSNLGEEVYPGTPGAVIAEGRLRQMTWGFPLVLKGKQGQPLKPKPVNNARTDKLGSPFWRASMASRRCLIPATAYAEAEGPKGGKTRTWMDLSDAEVFACAGLWRPSAEWGDCYAMVITEANEQVAPVHDRMPVLLRQADWEAWLDGDASEAEALCRPWEGELRINRTDTSWVKR